MIPLAAHSVPAVRQFVRPVGGEVIANLLSGNTYTIAHVIGEGNFGVVFSCADTWKSDLIVKVLKPDEFGPIDCRIDLYPAGLLLPPRNS